MAGIDDWAKRGDARRTGAQSMHIARPTNGEHRQHLAALSVGGSQNMAVALVLSPRSLFSARPVELAGKDAHRCRASIAGYRTGCNGMQVDTFRSSPSRYRAVTSCRTPVVTGRRLCSPRARQSMPWGLHSGLLQRWLPLAWQGTLRWAKRIKALGSARQTSG